MKNHSQNDINRTISNLFAVPAFKQVFDTGFSPLFVERMNKYRSSIGIRKNAVIGKAIVKAYSHLIDHYRNEYVYKNTIANKLLSERHDLDGAGLINELKIGNSIADVTVINGTNTTYEIKTELDSPDKLQKQLADYRTVSDKVFVVTHHSLVKKYEQLIQGASVGLIAFTENRTLETVIEAEKVDCYLDNTMMMNILRKHEYSAIVEHCFGSLPKVSNIHFYSACNRLISEINPLAFHEMVLDQLRKRIFKEKNMLSSRSTPFELKHICLAHNPNKREFQNLHNFLNLTL